MYTINNGTLSHLVKESLHGHILVPLSVSNSIIENIKTISTDALQRIESILLSDVLVYYWCGDESPYEITDILIWEHLYKKIEKELEGRF